MGLEEAKVWPPFPDVSRDVAKNLQTRLRELGGEIKRLARTNDPVARLEVTGKNSVSQIAQFINHLLAHRQTRDSRLREVAEFFQQTFWIRDAKAHRVTYLNGAGNLSSDSGAWVTAAHPNDRDLVKAMLARQRQGDSEQIEFRVSGPEGGVRWLWCRYLPVAGPRGTVSKTVGSLKMSPTRKKPSRFWRPPNSSCTM
jgi:PAS fold